MSEKTELAKWLEGVLEEKRPAEQPLVDVYEVAVAKGLAAQAMQSKGPANWLATWAAKLTPAQVEEIRVRRDAEFAAHQEDIEKLLGGEPEKWTADERAHAEATGRRLSAVNLVLGAREEGRGLPAIPFLPKEEDAQAAATAA